MTYVRQLMRTNRVDQAVFDRLKNRHDAQWMVELTEVADYFAFLSGWSTRSRCRRLPTAINCPPNL